MAATSETTSMEVEVENKAKRQRLNVMADDPEKLINDQRADRAELNKTQRDNVLRMVIAVHARFTHLLTDGKVERFSDLGISQQVTSIVMTVHNSTRQEAIGSGTMRAAMDARTHVVHSGTNTFTGMKHTVAKDLMKKIANAHGFKYGRPDKSDSNHWFGTISPLLCFIHLYKVRATELRVGHSKMTLKKEGDTTRMVSMSQYGLSGAHHILLEGISIPPEKRAGMAQSLGAMTSWVALNRSENDNKYSKRWKSAVMRDCSFLPEIESLINTICGKPCVEIRKIFGIIADILLITTSREAKRASFPACFLYMLLTKEESDHYKLNDTTYSPVTDIGWFNFSGAGAFQLYNKCATQPWTSPIRSESASLLPEIIFHSVFGSYGDDFSILKFMTSFNGWHTRNEMDKAFMNIGAQDPVTVNLIGIKIASKMTSANQTGLLSLSSSQVTTRSTFSGKHQHIFRDEFFEYMAAVKSTTGGSINNLVTLENILDNTREALLTELRNKPTQLRGTTSWYSVSMAKLGEWGDPVADMPTTSGDCFLSSAKKRV